jgi:hypothetical protein
MLRSLRLLECGSPAAAFSYRSLLRRIAQPSSLECCSLLPLFGLARALGLERSHLYKKCQQLGIDLQSLRRPE